MYFILLDPVQLTQKKNIMPFVFIWKNCEERDELSGIGEENKWKVSRLKHTTHAKKKKNAKMKKNK